MAMQIVSQDYITRDDRIFALYYSKKDLNITIGFSERTLFKAVETLLVEVWYVEKCNVYFLAEHLPFFLPKMQISVPLHIRFTFKSCAIVA